MNKDQKVFFICMYASFLVTVNFSIWELLVRDDNNQLFYWGLLAIYGLVGLLMYWWVKKYPKKN